MTELEEQERRCALCLGLVDDEGETLGECGWVAPATCEECGACFCDGSC